MTARKCEIICRGLRLKKFRIAYLSGYKQEEKDNRLLKEMGLPTPLNLLRKSRMLELEEMFNYAKRIKSDAFAAQLLKKYIRKLRRHREYRNL